MEPVGAVICTGATHYTSEEDLVHKGMNPTPEPKLLPAPRAGRAPAAIPGYRLPVLWDGGTACPTINPSQFLSSVVSILAFSTGE